MNFDLCMKVDHFNVNFQICCLIILLSELNEL